MTDNTPTKNSDEESQSDIIDIADSLPAETADMLIESLMEASDSGAYNRIFNLYRSAADKVIAIADGIAKSPGPDSGAAYTEVVQRMGASAEDFSRMTAITGRCSIYDMDRELLHQIRRIYQIARRNHGSILEEAFTIPGSVALYTYMLSLVRSERYAEATSVTLGHTYPQTPNSEDNHPVVYSIAGWGTGLSGRVDHLYRNQRPENYESTVRRLSIKFLSDVESEARFCNKYADTVDSILALSHYAHENKYLIDNPDEEIRHHLNLPRFEAITRYGKESRIRDLKKIKSSLLEGGLLNGDAKKFDTAVSRLIKRLENRF